MHPAPQVQLWPTHGRPEVSAWEGTTYPGRVPPACHCVPSGEMGVPGLGPQGHNWVLPAGPRCAWLCKGGWRAKKRGEGRGWGEEVQGGGG